MLSAHRSLVRTQQPAFKQSGNTMNAGHADVGWIPGVRQNNPLMSVTALRQFVVTAPSIGQNLGALFDNVTDERYKTVARHVRNPAHSHPTEPLRRMNFKSYNHNLFPFAATSSFAAQFAAANIGLIHFNAAAELIPTRTHHGVPQFVQPCPCSLITPQPKNAFQSQSTCAVFLAGHKPHRGKPSSQGQPCTIKDGASSYRDLTSALPTMKVTSTRRPWFGFSPALSTFKPVRPADTRKIAAACRFIGKPFQKRLVCTRVVLSRYRIRTVFHTATYYMLGALASSGYPLFIISGLVLTCCQMKRRLIWW